MREMKISMLGRQWGLALGMALLHPFAYAQEIPGYEQSFFNELPVVLTVTRLPQKTLEQPASLTVIDRRMIEASGANDVPDLLYLVAGFQLAHQGGTRTSATYHGLSDEYARRIQVLVDGRSIYMAANGGVDWPDIPLSLEDIERIEVLRGPNGETYGANSFLGVINIITRHASSTHGTYAKVQRGDGNYNRAVVRHGGRVGDLDYRITYEHQSDDGFEDGVTFPNKPRPYSIKDDKRSDRLTFRGDYRAGVNDYINVGLGYNLGPRGNGFISSGSSGNYDVETAPAFDSYNRRHFEQLKWRRILNSDDEFQFNLYHISTDTRASFETAPISDILNVTPAAVSAALGVPDQPLQVDQSILAERYDLEFQNRFRINNTMRLVWGWEARRDEVTAFGYLGQEEPIGNRLYRLFAHSEWRPIKHNIINAGAMVEHNDITGTSVSPRLALNHEFNRKHGMRISYTRAYRTPAIFEEYADYTYRLTTDGSVAQQLWKGSGDLKPERITSYELGFMGELNNRKNTYDIKFFREEIRDVITHIKDNTYTQPYAGSGAIIFENRDWADLYGYEAQVKLEAEKHTMVSLAFSHVDTSGVVTKEINPSSVKPASDYVPSYTLSVLIDHDFGHGWRGSVGMYSVDHQTFWQTTSVSKVDLRVAKSFRVYGKEATLAVAARDVGGSYFDFQDELVIEPRIYASLEMGF